MTSSIKYGLLIIGICISLAGRTQHPPKDPYYKHFTGTLDTSMNITFDLQAKDGILNGFYYYFFPEPGNEQILHYGKTIPIAGESSGSKIILSEFSNTESRFEGTFDRKGNISGTWKQNEKEKPIPFVISEDYSNGSIPMKCYTLTDYYTIKTESRIYGKPPRAKIDLILLYPDLGKGTPLKDTFDVILTTFLLDEIVFLSSPNVLLEDMKFDFFTSYKNAMEGIENYNPSALFNWDKKVSMDVNYNENNLLSLKIEKYAFTGGAHGIVFTEFIVINTRENRRIDLQDIFQPGFDENLNNILNQKLRKLNGIKEEEKLKEAGFFEESISYNDNFYVNNDGIGFFYNRYAIAPYSAGTTELFLTFREIKPLLNHDHPFIWGMRE